MPVTKAQKLKRLQRLETLLLKCPEEVLDMRHLSHRSECGTTYCLAGLMAQDAYFRRYTTVTLFLALDLLPPSRPVVRYFRNAPHDLFTMLAEIFDISQFDAEALFGLALLEDVVPPTRAEVRKNIARLIRGVRARPYRGAQLAMYDAPPAKQRG